MTKENITIKSLTVAFAAVVGIGSLPYACGYAQAKFAPEATTAHIPTLEADCRASTTTHERLTCAALLNGIQLAQN